MQDDRRRNLVVLRDEAGVLLAEGSQQLRGLGSRVPQARREEHDVHIRRSAAAEAALHVASRAGVVIEKRAQAVAEASGVSRREFPLEKLPAFLGGAGLFVAAGYRSGERQGDRQAQPSAAIKDSHLWLLQWFASR